MRIDTDDRDAHDAAADEICARTASASVHRLGKILVLWRPKPEEEQGASYSILAARWSMPASCSTTAVVFPSASISKVSCASTTVKK